jgi:hypothetical protein
MRFLVAKAYWKLILFDFYVTCRNFHGLYRSVRGRAVCNKPAFDDAVEQICYAVDMASIWYWKEVLCLQRSAATTCLLREHGVAAEMVIGAQQMPFKAHAWVEVNDRIVNDKPHMRDVYVVLDRC